MIETPDMEVAVIGDTAKCTPAIADTPPEERLVEFVSELTGLPWPRVVEAAPHLRRRPPNDPDLALGDVAQAIVVLRRRTHAPVGD